MEYDAVFQDYVTKNFLKRHFPRKRLSSGVGFKYGYIIPPMFTGGPERRYIAKTQKEEVYGELYEILHRFLGMTKDEITMALVMYLR